jgi:hypothetical protein
VSHPRPFRVKRRRNVVLALAFLSVSGSGAVAQLNNMPYAFRGTADGSVGMSVGGRQAILNQQISGITPANLVRGVNGQLLDVQKSAGGTAIVSYPGTGQTIPQFYGTSYREGRPDISVGTFNSFFVPGSGASGGYSSVSHIHSGATVSTWTGRVITGGAPVSYLGEGNSVDSWTGGVHTLGPVTYYTR